MKKCVVAAVVLLALSTTTWGFEIITNHGGMWLSSQSSTWGMMWPHQSSSLSIGSGSGLLSSLGSNWLSDNDCGGCDCGCDNPCNGGCDNPCGGGCDNPCGGGCDNPCGGGCDNPCGGGCGCDNPCGSGCGCTTPCGSGCGCDCDDMVDPFDMFNMFFTF